MQSDEWLSYYIATIYVTTAASHRDAVGKSTQRSAHSALSLCKLHPKGRPRRPGSAGGALLPTDHAAKNTIWLVGCPGKVLVGNQRRGQRPGDTERGIVIAKPPL